MTPDPVLTLAEAAQALRVGEAWLKQQVRAERVPHLRFSRKRICFTSSQVDEIAHRHAVTPRGRSR